jgi:hypothetical protein
MKRILPLIISIILISCSKTEIKPEQASSLPIEEVPVSNSLIENNVQVNNAPEPLPEFAEIKWHTNFGNLKPVENITIESLNSSSWHRYSTGLFFSISGNYALLDRWGTPQYGKYMLENNVIFFEPQVKVIKFTEDYSFDKLYYSNELHFDGTPVLMNDDETVVFSAPDTMPMETGITVRLYQHYCEKISEEGKVKTNGFLFTLPDSSSENMFYDNYYGRKATEAIAIKLAKTTINNVVWYYTLFDFTSGDPTDGGGPFYYGWLSQEYFE